MGEFFKLSEAKGLYGKRILQYSEEKACSWEAMGLEEYLPAEGMLGSILIFLTIVLRIITQAIYLKYKRDNIPSLSVFH